MPGQATVGGSEVHSHGRIALRRIGGLIPLHVSFEFGCDAGNIHESGGLRLRSVDRAENARDGRIHRSGEPGRARCLQQVNGTLDVVGANIGKVTLLRCRGEDGGLERLRDRLWLGLVVSEEEHLVLEAWNERQQWTADGADRVVLAGLEARQPLEISEERIGVEGLVLKLLQELAMIFVGAALSRRRTRGAFAPASAPSPVVETSPPRSRQSAPGEREEAGAAALKRWELLFILSMMLLTHWADH